MSVIGSACIHKDYTIEQLYKKHQQNPDNNGVRIIDKVNSFDSDETRIVPGKLLSIRIAGSERTFHMELKNGERFLLGLHTAILTNDGFGTIADGQIKPSTKIAIFDGDRMEFYSVVHLTEIYEMLKHYELRIQNKNNYVLDNGMIIKAD